MFGGNLLKLELGHENIAKYFDTPQIKIYPNPCNSHLYLQGTSAPIGFNILSKEGKTIQTGISSSSGRINLNALPVGSYILHLESGQVMPFAKQ